MKKILLLSTLALLLSACNKTEKNDECLLLGTRSTNFGATYYYLLDGLRIPVQQMDGKFYVMFYTTNESEIRSELSRVGVELIIKEEIKDINNQLAYSYYMTGSGVKRFAHYRTAIIESSYEKAATALAHTLYWAPYYRDESKQTGTEEFGITNLFYVKIRGSIEALVNLTMEHSVEMIGANKYLQGWYVLGCTNLSKGDALEMTNIFYDSGLFENVATDVFGLGKIH